MKDSLGHIHGPLAEGRRQPSYEGDTDVQRPTLTSLLNRLGVELNCIGDEIRTMSDIIIHSPNADGARQGTQIVDARPPNMLATLEQYVEQAETLHKLAAYLRERI